MTKKSINVIGIMIGAEYKDFRLYHKGENWENSTHKNSWAEGIEDIIGYLSIPMEPDANTQFVIVYDVSCPNKKEHIEKLLAEINKNKKDDLLPTLISIGHEQSPWNEDITGQVSIIKEIANTGTRNDLLKTIIERELRNIKAATTLHFIKKTKQLTTSYFDQITKYLKSEDWSDWQNALDTAGLARKELNIIQSEIEADSLLSKNDRAKLLVMLTSFNKEMLHIENELRPKMESVLREARETPETHSISMMVLGGFIATVGITAIAIAFTVLNTATFGTAGLVMAGIGFAAALSGVGLFATGAYKNKSTTSDISLDHSNNVVPV